MTTELAGISLWCERWAAGSASAAQAVGEIRKLCEGVTAGDIVAAHRGSSAEQLAIALMSEARTFADTPIGDRLAQWATDVRQLGNAETRKREAEDDLVMCNEEVERLRLRLERVRELVGRIEPYDHGKLVAAQVRDIMDVLDG